ncbi:hypothetical protein [Streptomyces sp. NPDC048489]|uniref:hypothetical protein n=1 Tax=Streptomyces sp. NPDC048489 TaxID=3154504 RepID=UPI00341F83AD
MEVTVSGALPVGVPVGEGQSGGFGEQVELEEVDVAQGDREEPDATLVEADLLEADDLLDGVASVPGEVQVGVGQGADGELLTSGEESGSAGDGRFDDEPSAGCQRLGDAGKAGGLTALGHEEEEAGEGHADEIELLAECVEFGHVADTCLPGRPDSGRAASRSGPCWKYRPIAL